MCVAVVRLQRERLPVTRQRLVGPRQIVEAGAAIAVGVGIVRLEGNRPVVIPERLIEAIEQPQRVGPGVMGLGEAGRQGDGAVERHNRLVEPLQMRQRDAEIVERRRRARVDFRRCLECGGGFLVAAEAHQETAEIVVSVIIIRIERGPTAMGRHGLLEVLLRTQQPRGLLRRPGMACIERQHMLVSTQRLLKTLLSLQEIAKRDPDLDEIRLQLEREVVALEGLVETVAARQQRNETKKIIGIGLVAPDRLRDAFEREIELVVLRMDQPEKMQRVRMPRIRGERLSAFFLRLRQPAGPEMPQAGLEQRRRLFGRLPFGPCSRHGRGVSDSPIAKKAAPGERRLQHIDGFSGHRDATTRD